MGFMPREVVGTFMSMKGRNTRMLHLLVRIDHQRKGGKKQVLFQFSLLKSHKGLWFGVFQRQKAEIRLPSFDRPICFSNLGHYYFGQFEAKQRNKHATNSSNLFCYCGKGPPIVSTLPLLGFSGLEWLQDALPFTTISSEKGNIK